MPSVPIRVRWQTKEPPPKGEKYQSYSSIRAYLKCPEHKYKKIYIEHKRDGISTENIVGNAWHSVWENYNRDRWHNSRLSGKPIDTSKRKEELQTLYYEWDVNFQAHYLIGIQSGRLHWDGDRTPAEFRETGKKLIISYYPIAVQLVPDGLEKSFLVDLTDVPDKLFGYMDLTTGQGVVDYKCHMTHRAAEYSDPVSDYQTDIYTVGFQETHRKWPEYVQLHKAIFDPDNPTVEIVNKLHSVEQVQERINDIKRIIREINEATNTGTFECRCKRDRTTAA
jgi:hypothetical protein